MATLKFDGEYSAIPGNTQDGLERYLVHKIPPGGFLTAVLENDLMGAFNRADLGNQRAMHLIAKFLYNRMPIGSYGSKQQVNDWLNNEM